MEILSHVFDFVKMFLHNLLPFVVINQYEHGVILRFGKYHKNIEAGLTFKWPMIDSAMYCRNTITTLVIRNQSLTTKDEFQITIEGIVKYKIVNAKKFLLEVEDSIDAISDITQAKIKDLVTHKTWEEVKGMSDSEIKDLAIPEVKEFGIKIYYITITSLVKTRVYKFINNQNHQ
jgi:regulator of protease activity HflC (stomatin/prohibitin superfamily)